ncbi:hypothetical protein M8J75_010358 [Diaphorina citri]|nr:hypothetical protein M8J75_004674 [Diaphorina citri]KAI5712673.1 hypothetical protein M8J75_010358 [Diaphorina citri]
MMNRKDIIKGKSKYICEDHFELEKDMEDYEVYLVSKKEGGEILGFKIKEGILPHKYDCQPDRRASHSKPQRTLLKKIQQGISPQDLMEAGPSSREMVDIIEIGLEDLEVNNEVLLDEDTLIADDLPMEEKTVQLGDGNILTTEKEYVSRAVQVKVQYRSKSIQVAPEKKDISTSPIKNKGIIRLPVIHSSSESSLLSSIPTVVPPLDSSYQINTSMAGILKTLPDLAWTVSNNTLSLSLKAQNFCDAAMSQKQQHACNHLKHIKQVKFNKSNLIHSN